ncbi:MAG: DUF4249 family protein [Maribacter sp.]|uniref:DUF4249 family protein n=1 Tax=Maribacter sp. TaxID=1897614 RepID=UPI003298D4F4
MIQLVRRSFKKSAQVCLILLVSFSCTDPVKPEFDFEEGLIFIEGLASTVAGSSYTKITVSAIEFGVYKNIDVSDAKVDFINVSSRSVMPLQWNGELYIPSQDFAVALGEEWQIKVILPDGREYRSLPEQATKPVDIGALETSYNPELRFDVGLNRFIPGHRLLVSFEDPSDTKNYYFWQFRTFERIVICKVCTNGYFREEMCQSFDPAIPADELPPYYTYTCEETCWQIRYGQSINLFEDQFTNGISTNQFPVGEVFLFSKRDLLIELQQFALSQSAFDYYQTLKDIIDDNAGFNAPLPASLVGNLFNVNDSNEFVLGRFTVTAASTKHLFLERAAIAEPALETILTLSPEGFGSLAPDPKILLATCQESRYRTAIRPEGWKD